MKAHLLQKAKDDKALLIARGYIVREFTPYHWHVRRKGSQRAVNVWPTAGKWCEVGAHGVERYGNVIDAVERVFADDLGKAEASVNDLRAGGLNYLRNRK